MRNRSTEMKSRTNWRRLEQMRDQDVNLSDIPRIDLSLLRTMKVRMPEPKELVSIRIDPDVLTWFRNQGRRYQTRMNAVLRSYVEAHS
jgi:uncharacterized protein (DUF4415 family)